MIEKINPLIPIDAESNNVNSNGENVLAIILKLYHLFFLENC